MLGRTWPWPSIYVTGGQAGHGYAMSAQWSCISRAERTKREIERKRERKDLLLPPPRLVLYLPHCIEPVLLLLQ